MDSFFSEGSLIFNERYGVGLIKGIPRTITVNGVSTHAYQVKFGNEVKTILKEYIRPVTEEELAKYKANSVINNSEYAEEIKTYIRWLREAGSCGVTNVCLCPKNEWLNYTCKCRTLVKLNHRFSVFKDILVNKAGYKIEDVKLTDGNHKTILISEP